MDLRVVFGIFLLATAAALPTQDDWVEASAERTSPVKATVFRSPRTSVYCSNKKNQWQAFVGREIKKVYCEAKICAPPVGGWKALTNSNAKKQLAFYAKKSGNSEAKIRTQSKAIGAAPATAGKTFQVVLGPSELLGPYYAHMMENKADPKYLVLASDNWTKKMNADLISCSLKQEVKLELNGKTYTQNLAEPVRLVLHEDIEGVLANVNSNGHHISGNVAGKADITQNRITGDEMCGIQSAIKDFDVKLVDRTTKDAPYEYIFSRKAKGRRDACDDCTFGKKKNGDCKKAKTRWQEKRNKGAY